MSDLPSVFEFSTDIADAEAPPPLPVGEYEAQIVKAEPALSQNSGNQYAAVSFRIDPAQYPPDFDGAEIYPDGVTLVYRRVVLEENPVAMYNLKNFLLAIDVAPSKMVDLNEWVGQSARVRIAHEVYEGVNRHQIAAVSSLV